MAEYLLRSSLNPNKVVKCTITFRSITNKGEEGEPVWVVEINTPEPHKDGGNISPVFIHYSSANDLDLAIKEATKEISAQIDWSPENPDSRAPFVCYNYPEDGDMSVDINSDVIVDIKDLLPSAGIDPSSIRVVINDVDVTSDLEIDGDPYNYKIRWFPTERVLDTYL